MELAREGLESGLHSGDGLGFQSPEDVLRQESVVHQDRASRDFVERLRGFVVFPVLFHRLHGRFWPLRKVRIPGENLSHRLGQYFESSDMAWMGIVHVLLRGC